MPGDLPEFDSPCESTLTDLWGGFEAFLDVCNLFRYSLASYKWIRTNRELSVIIPLCRQHHLETHKYAKKMNISIRLATNQLRKKYKPNWNKECKQKTNLKN